MKSILVMLSLLPSMLTPLLAQEPSPAKQGDPEKDMQTFPSYLDTGYDQKHRPQFHFTSRKNWLNDPNGVVMGGLLKACKLKNVVTEQSIDHILYSTARPIKLLEVKRDWGPKNLNDKNERYEGRLSDHPWIYCELEIPANTDSK